MPDNVLVHDTLTRLVTMGFTIVDATKIPEGIHWIKLPHMLVPARVSVSTKTIKAIAPKAFSKPVVNMVLETIAHARPSTQKLNYN